MEKIVQESPPFPKYNLKILPHTLQYFYIGIIKLAKKIATTNVLLMYAADQFCYPNLVKFSLRNMFPDSNGKARTLENLEVHWCVKASPNYSNAMPRHIHPRIGFIRSLQGPKVRWLPSWTWLYSVTEWFGAGLYKIRLSLRLREFETLQAQGARKMLTLIRLFCP